MTASTDEIRRQLEESARVKQAFPDVLLQSILQFAQKCAAALRAGGKVVFFGNGGSAADALHLAAELVVKLRDDRRGLAALALTTNPSVLTAAGNDYGFEQIFARQIESLVSPLDVLVALSTSGDSANILRGIEAGRGRRAFLVALTGESGRQAGERGGPAAERSFARSTAHSGSAHHHRAHRLLADRATRSAGVTATLLPGLLLFHFYQGNPRGRERHYRFEQYRGPRIVVGKVQREMGVLQLCSRVEHANLDLGGGKAARRHRNILY
jgi:D-sedoheptulose 7-phosphate isomerase